MAKRIFLALANFTEKCAASGLHDLPDRRFADGTILKLTAVNLDPVDETALLARCVEVRQHRRSAAFNGFLEDRGDRAIKFLNFRLLERICPAFGTDPAAKEDLGGVNVPDPGDKILIHQECLDRTLVLL